MDRFSEPFQYHEWHSLHFSFPLLARFEVHEIFETVDRRGHIPADGSPFHLAERFVGKLKMIHHIYQIRKTQDFINQMKKCHTNHIVRNEL